MKRIIFTIAILLLQSAWCVKATASPIDGNWEVIWPCEGATGVYADRCAQGDRDYFSLDLWTKGNAVCGFHISTAHLGNRVDEGDLLDGDPTLTGTTEGASAKIAFRSAWGATGTATLRVEDSKLYWKILNQTEGMSWLPNEAVLLKRSTSKKTQSPECEIQQHGNSR